MLVFEPTRNKKLAPLFWRPRAKPQTPNLFMSLPPELRNRIYALIIPRGRFFAMVEEVAKQEPEKKARNRKTKKKPQPSVDRDVPFLRVSKQIRAEAACVFYGNNSFRLIATLDFERFQAALELCHNIVKICGPRPFHGLKLDLGGIGPNVSQHDIVQLLPLLELMRKLKFEPDIRFVAGDAVTLDDKVRSIASGASVFRSGLNAVGRDILGRAIALGRRARDQDWTETKLEVTFEKFVKFASRPKRQRSKPWPGIF